MRPSLKSGNAARRGRVAIDMRRLVVCAWLAVAAMAGCGGADATEGTADSHAIADKAQAAYDAKDYATCGPAFAQADDPYDAACCYALGGDCERAFGELDRMIDGDTSAETLSGFAADHDFDAIRGDARWPAVAARVAAKRAAYDAANNAELTALYAADQGDRQGGADAIDWTKVEPRDRAREKRVDDILAAGGARSGADFYHAAMVWQHGQGVPAYEHAHELALVAVTLDPANKTARWLAAASEDRLLVNEHELQRWGTQYQKRDEGWVLNEYDPTTTDAERALWNVPPLAVAQQRARDMNAAH